MNFEYKKSKLQGCIWYLCSETNCNSLIQYARLERIARVSFMKEEHKIQQSACALLEQSILIKAWNKYGLVIINRMFKNIELQSFEAFNQRDFLVASCSIAQFYIYYFIIKFDE